MFYQGSNGIMVVGYTTKGGTFVAEKPRLWSEHQILTAPRPGNDTKGSRPLRLISFNRIPSPRRRTSLTITAPYCIWIKSQQDYGLGVKLSK